MAAITLQFCRYKSLAGRIIAFGTQGSVNHVSFVLPEGHPRAGDLLDAQDKDGLGGQPSGYYVRPASYAFADDVENHVRVTLPTSAACAAAALNWAWMQIGTPYDVRAIEGIALNQDWSSENKLICSGAAAGLLTQPNPSFLGQPLAKHWRVITPEELLLVCSAFAPVTPFP